MTLVEQIAPGAIGPGVASATVFALAALLYRRTRASWLRDAGVALAVAAGFAVGFMVVLRWPALPLAPGTDAFYWVAWFAVAGWLVGCLELSPRVPLLVRGVLRTGTSLGAAWLLLHPLVPHARSLGEAWALAGGSALVMAGIWTVAASEVRDDEAPGRVALPFMVAAGTTAAVFAFLAGSLSMGQVTGGLSASLGAAFGLGWLLKTPATSRATAPVIALVYGGLLLSAYGYLNYGDSIHFPLISGLLLLLGGVLGALLARATRRAPRVVGVVVSALPPLLLAALAAWIAHANAPPPNPYAL